MKHNDITFMCSLCEQTFSVEYLSFFDLNNINGMTEEEVDKYLMNIHEDVLCIDCGDIVDSDEEDTGGAPYSEFDYEDGAYVDEGRRIFLQNNY